jgi:opacity protein-like surface antigen
MKTLTTLLCLAVLACAADARAQWDVAGQLALLNRNKAELSQWDRWYSAPAIDGSAGRYWTPHFKTELEIGTAGQGTIDGTESTPVPGSSFPYQRYREHTFRETTVGATALYQFFENQWIHPFVGAGVELVRERHSADSLAGTTTRPSVAFPALGLPAVPAINRVTYSVRPLVTGGFKFYVSPRAFIRTEVRTSLAADRPLALQWRGGIGFDF